MGVQREVQSDRRCSWARTPEAVAYHDHEWGAPEHDEIRLFELLTLEGAQAGLSWNLILQRREGYRSAFHQFDVDEVAHMTDEDLERLMSVGSVIRNRAKIESVRKNARAMQAMRQHGETLDELIWSVVEGKPIVGAWRSVEQIPAVTGHSRLLSKLLKERGFGFVGPTTCYSYLQGAGAVNDHIVDCFRFAELTA